MADRRVLTLGGDDGGAGTGSELYRSNTAPSLGDGKLGKYDKKLQKQMAKDEKKQAKEDAKAAKVDAKAAKKLEKREGKLAKWEERYGSGTAAQAFPGTQSKLAGRSQTAPAAVAGGGEDDDDDEFVPMIRDPRTSPQVEVPLAKDEHGSTGLGCADAMNDEDFPICDRLRAGSPAQLTGALIPGDRIKSVNGISCKGKPRHFVYELVKSAEDSAILQVFKTGMTFKCVSTEDVVCMRTVPQLAARCDVNIGYGGIVESCGTCIGENGLEYIMAISAEGSGYYPLRHPATGEPLFAAEEVMPAQMLAGIFGKAGPGAVRLPQPSMADVTKHSAKHQTEDRPPYVAETPAYSEGPTKFGSASGSGGAADSQTSRTNHTRLEEPAYQEPAPGGRHLAGVGAALAAGAARSKKQGSAGQSVSFASASAGGGNGARKETSARRKEASPWVHVGKPKSKEDGKAWVASKLPLPQGRPDGETDGLFMIRSHKAANEYIISCYVRGTLFEHLIVCNQDGKSTINQRHFGRFATIDQMVLLLSTEPLPIEPKSGKPWPVRLSAGIDANGKLVRVGRPAATAVAKGAPPRSDSNNRGRSGTASSGAMGRALAGVSSLESSTDGARARTKSIGVRHGDIKTTGQVGGFTETRLPIAKECKVALAAASKAKMITVVTVKIDQQNNAVVHDFSQAIRDKFGAGAVQAIMNPTDPRFYFLAGGRLASFGSIFIYCCPSASKRTDRMIYATAKKSLLEMIKTGLGRPPAVSIELSDVSELTNDELMGNQPDQFSPPPTDAQGTAKPQLFQPEDEQGSLSSFMAQTLNRNPNGGTAPPTTTGRVKIVRPPKGAYG